MKGSTHFWLSWASNFSYTYESYEVKDNDSTNIVDQKHYTLEMITALEARNSARINFVGSLDLLVIIIVISQKL